MIIVRIGLGISIQETSNRSISTSNTASSSVKQISIRMTRTQHTRDDHSHIIDIQDPGPCQGSKLDILLDNSTHCIGADSFKLVDQPILDVNITRV